ncbi:DUF4286 family protein [Streptomyces sp. NBC_00102]|uniref:DUF4286 family protein n=1 Tax=Streptomyces sp. NBC_00102 TaxID=2975652 RepID=UPI0022540A25|nr:DUF4286 family protein [Streptomyces sp. NBC_00102]MCX5401230.1 hypothetical protein [Streptomyces sp. NBC_00102]
MNEEAAAEFDQWYTDVHVPEVVALDGFVSATRYAPPEPYGPYVALYAIDGDPDKVMQGLLAAVGEGPAADVEDAGIGPGPVLRGVEVRQEYVPADWRRRYALRPAPRCHRRGVPGRLLPHRPPNMCASSGASSFDGPSDLPLSRAMRPPAGANGRRDWRA